MKRVKWEEDLEEVKFFRKTDLIIQITPSVITDNVSGIPKSEEMIMLERSIMLKEQKDSRPLPEPDGLTPSAN